MTRAARALLRGATRWAAVAALLAAAGVGRAHNGEFGPQAAGPPPPKAERRQDDGSRQVPPGPADHPGPVTRWETWWAANKEFHLRLGERIPGTSQGASPGTAEGETVEQLRARLLPIFVDALGHELVDVRVAAAMALGRTGEDAAAKPLQHAATKDRHIDVQNAAVLALGVLGRKEDIPLLADVLQEAEEDDRRRSFAAFALGLVGGEDAAALLVRVASQTRERTVGRRAMSPRLISSCYVAVGLTGDRAMLPHLRDALGEHRRLDENTRSFVLLSLGRLRDRASLDPVMLTLRKEKDETLRRAAAIALGRIATAEDGDAVDGLLGALRGDRDAVTRHFAAVSLGGLADGATSRRLADRFPEADDVDRSYLALALGVAGHRPAAPLLRAALRKEKDVSSRGALCLALGLLGDEEAVPLVIEQLRTKGSAPVRSYAALALGLLRDPRAIGPLHDRLEETGDSREAMNLAVALGVLGDPMAKAHFLRQMEREGNLYVRGSAAMSLGVMRYRDAAPALLRTYRDEHEHALVRAFAVTALGLLVDPAPVPRLAKVLIGGDPSNSLDPLNDVLGFL